MQLERNRTLFESSLRVQNLLKNEFQETTSVKGENSVMGAMIEINSRTEALDEDDLY